MSCVCLYFQVHQPTRLRRYSVFDVDRDYFDDDRNARILQSVAQKCYLPATQLLLELIERHQGRFRVAFSLTGVVIEQLQQQVPEVLNRFRQLAQTGHCEFLAETYYHSLASIYDPAEFQHQLDKQHELTHSTFGYEPRVFRNTELIYDNQLAQFIASLGRYRGIIAEGADQVLGTRSPNHLYHPPDQHDLPLLLKNYKLSDDIAFRFSDRRWSEWPLTAEKYAGWIDRAPGTLRNLFMDFETFGEHQWADTGIFDFLRALPDELLRRGHVFQTPSQIIDAHSPADQYDVPQAISWADTERDLSAWIGNAMQFSALKELFRLQQPIFARDDAALHEDWRKLTTSDHFYYMCTKYFEDGQVHKYFNPYESPYDSYINFMNVLDNMRTRIDASVSA